MNQKMIFTLLRPIWGPIHEMEGNFKYLAHEPWPRTCGRIILKFNKKQMKFENHKFCGTKLIRFRTSCHKSKHLRRKTHRVEKEPFRFWVKWAGKWGFDFKIFCIYVRILRTYVWTSNQKPGYFGYIFGYSVVSCYPFLSLELFD